MQSRLQRLNELTELTFEKLIGGIKREATDVERRNLTEILSDFYISGGTMTFSIADQKFVVEKRLLYTFKAVALYTKRVLSEDNFLEMPELDILIRPAEQNQDDDTLILTDGRCYSISTGAHFYAEALLKTYIAEEERIYMKFKTIGQGAFN